MQLLGDPGQQATRDRDVARRNASQGAPHREFRRADAIPVHRAPSGGERQVDAAAIIRVGHAGDETAAFETREDAADGAAVQMQHAREPARVIRGCRPMCSRQSRCGPVRPTVASMRLETRCRSWSSFQIARRNSWMMSTGRDRRAIRPATASAPTDRRPTPGRDARPARRSDRACRLPHSAGRVKAPL